MNYYLADKYRGNQLQRYPPFEQIAPDYIAIHMVHILKEGRDCKNVENGQYSGSRSIQTSGAPAIVYVLKTSRAHVFINMKT